MNKRSKTILKQRLKNALPPFFVELCKFHKIIKNGSGFKYFLKKIIPPCIVDFFKRAYRIKAIFIRKHNKINFSVLMITYNRAFCIENAINSVLKQTYKNFELIIVDDGSTDNTKRILFEKYKHFFDIGKFKYYRLQKNSGESCARNYSLTKANYDWIVYLDTDNTITRNFLSEFNDAIITHKDFLCFYCKSINSDGVFYDERFSYDTLLDHNCLDTGKFVHHISMVERFGAFDTKIKFAPDWDLFLRYTKNNQPFFVRKFLLNYCTDDSFERISNVVKQEQWIDYIRNKYKKI